MGACLDWHVAHCVCVCVCETAAFQGSPAAVYHLERITFPVAGLAHTLPGRVAEGMSETVYSYLSLSLSHSLCHTYTLVSITKQIAVADISVIPLAARVTRNTAVPSIFLSSLSLSSPPPPLCLPLLPLFLATHRQSNLLLCWSISLWRNLEKQSNAVHKTWNKVLEM